jgi:hypothetical protein
MKRKQYYCIVCDTPLIRTATKFCDKCRANTTQRQKKYLIKKHNALVKYRRSGTKPITPPKIPRRCAICYIPLNGLSRKYCPDCREQGKKNYKLLWYYNHRKNFGQMGGKREGAGRKKKPLNTL